MFALKGIVAWNKARNNNTFNAMSEHSMLCEEMDELLIAMQNKDEHEIIDALCDIIVLATGAVYKLGYDIDDAMCETMLEINSRDQDPIQKLQWEENGAQGKWQKWLDQPKETLYKANYGKAK